jgi:toxin-antitoxin system PIN domain toxin
MPVALLDINVLLALAWPSHVHHAAARRWFASHRNAGWATCPQTEWAFLRLSIQPTVVKASITFADAFSALAASLNTPEHYFWPLDYPATQIISEIRHRLVGHHQLGDALLLDLAIRRSGRLATFDRRLANLLPADSPHQRSIELLPD